MQGSSQEPRSGNECRCGSVAKLLVLATRTECHPAVTAAEADGEPKQRRGTVKARRAGEAGTEACAAGLHAHDTAGTGQPGDRKHTGRLLGGVGGGKPRPDVVTRTCEYTASH